MIKIKQINRNRKGISLIEMLVGIAIAAMVILAISSLFTVLINSDSRNKRVEALEQARYEITAELTEAVRWADAVDITSSGNCNNCGSCKLKITKDSVDTTYKITSGIISKQTSGAPKSIHSADVVTTCFKAVSLTTNPDLAGLEINIKLQHKKQTTLIDNLKIVVSQRKTSI